MKNLEISIIPYYDDNFAYLIHENASGKTALVDCGEAEPIIERINEKKWGLDYILATHFHFDHVGEIDAVKTMFPQAQVVKPVGESRLAAEGIEVGDGDRVAFGSTEITAVSLPAHTMHCTGFLVEGNLFVGDALFSAGCGRLFEGVPADLECAMDKIASYPDETRIYFGHEYTQSNIRFAQSIEPENAELKAYQNRVDDIIKSGRFSTPTTVFLEKQINPFLRVDQPDVVRAVDPEGKLNRTERLGALRSRKDSF